MGATHNVDQEYWRPAAQATHEVPAMVRPHTETCPRCSTEFVVGARYCYVCGTERDTAPERATGSPVSRYLDFGAIKEALGLTASSLVAFIFGTVCVLAAVATGLIYTANTVLDWQAVQVWRIEWLLAAITAFVAGILLKRS